MCYSGNCPYEDKYGECNLNEVVPEKLTHPDALCIIEETLASSGKQLQYDKKATKLMNKFR